MSVSVRLSRSMFNPFAETTNPDPPDEELVRQATAGYRDALERLIRRHQGWVYNVAVRMVWRTDRAEDATQEILLASQVGQSAEVGGFKRVRVKEGQNESFESLFSELQAQVRECEPGTVYYDLFRSRTDQQGYFVLEKYESREAWEAHQHSAHGKVLFPQMRAILDELSVEYFDGQGDL
jgi:quinol monooxygenase YgiN